MKSFTIKLLTLGLALALCLALASAADAKPPPGGKGGGGKKGGGKTALVISFPDCPSGFCTDPIRPDVHGNYTDGIDGVQAFLNTEGGELVFNTGKRTDPRDVHWTFAGGVLLFDDITVIEDTNPLDPNSHRSILDVGRNAGVDIKGLKIADGDVAIDMWANLDLNFTGKKRDTTTVFPRFESARTGGGGQRCETGMGGTDVTIRCVEEDGGGSCTAWEIDGTDPASSGDPAVACVFAVFPGSKYRDDYILGPFKIRAEVK